MKTGILITAYNRPEYLRQCFESLSKITYKGKLEILVIDDCSNDLMSIQIIELFLQSRPGTNKIRMSKNQGIKNALKVGFNYLFAKHCDLVINLDGDAIVKPEFVDVLIRLKNTYPADIVSGFNTQTIDPKTRQIRHRTLTGFPDHCIKKSIGGINMVLNKNDYVKKVLPALKKLGHWDWNVCTLVNKFIVCTPSVVQHIGIDKGSNMNNPDIAFDF